MKDVYRTDVEESMKALQSAIRKSERALAQMVQKGASTTLISKRLKALKVGLIILENGGEPLMNSVDRNELSETKSTLQSLLPSIESIYRQARPDSSQFTLLKRRIAALNLIVQVIDENEQN